MPTLNDKVPTDFSGSQHTAPLLKHFTYAHLPENLQDVSAECCEMARRLAYVLPDSPELTAGLRKLLEAKDCFVRAAMEWRDE